jgi:uncharacterized protein (TIGR03083 family)
MTLTGTRSDKAFWLAALRQETAALRAAAGAEGAFDSPVPSCPGWTVGTLLRHTGALFGWVAGHVVRGETGQPERPPRDGLPDGDELLPWWDENLAAVLTALDKVDPELPAWNWAPQSKVAGFWHRRMAHEMAIHRWDAQVAVGLPEPIETSLAIDGVDEVLDTWLPAGRAHEPHGDGVVQLIAADTEESWIVRVRDDAVSLLDTATLLPEEHSLRTQITGSASDLELALYGRVPFDILEINGEAALLSALKVG